MELFISWSGNRSQVFAEKLAEWLPDVLQSVKPFVSANDIDKGIRWQNELAGRLNAANFGIIVVTEDTLRSPWLNFEAGALSRTFAGQAEARVATLLLDIDNASDVPQPLGQFNATVATKDDILKLLKSINAASGDLALDNSRLARLFENLWQPLRNAIREAQVTPEPLVAESQTTIQAGETQDQKLNEVLAILREMERNGAKSPSRRSSPNDRGLADMMFNASKRLGLSLTTVSEGPKDVELEFRGGRKPRAMDRAYFQDLANEQGIPDLVINWLPASATPIAPYTVETSSKLHEE